MKRFRWLAFVCVIALVLAACGRSDAPVTAESTTTTSGPEVVKAGTFGTSGVVCQEGKASGAPALGVTATEVRLATFSDTGFAGRPGLNQELFDTAKVFSEWCNAA